jgi:hypothetical protein
MKDARRRIDVNLEELDRVLDGERTIEHASAPGDRQGVKGESPRQ